MVVNGSWLVGVDDGWDVAIPVRGTGEILTVGLPAEAPAEATVVVPVAAPPAAWVVERVDSPVTVSARHRSGIRALLSVRTCVV